MEKGDRVLMKKETKNEVESTWIKERKWESPLPLQSERIWFGEYDRKIP